MSTLRIATYNVNHVLAKGLVATSAVVHNSPRRGCNWTPSDHFPVVVEFCAPAAPL